jgi:hypothetical protein
MKYNYLFLNDIFKDLKNIPHYIIYILQSINKINNLQLFLNIFLKGKILNCKRDIYYLK